LLLGAAPPQRANHMNTQPGLVVQLCAVVVSCFLVAYLGMLMKCRAVPNSMPHLESGFQMQQWQQPTNNVSSDLPGASATNAKVMQVGRWPTCQSNEPVMDLRLPSIPVNMIAPQSTRIRAMVEKGKCLEIGPKDSPRLPIRHNNSFFLDVLPRDELIANYKRHGTHLNVERVPEINYVWDGTKTYAELTKGAKFVQVVASHVLEHVPDPIGWFAMMAEILEPGGTLQLNIPDKRYDFDYRRRVSSLADLMAAFVEKRKRPTVAMAYDSELLIYPHRNNPAEHWAGHHLNDQVRTTAKHIRL